jgi:hypothetical protein
MVSELRNGKKERQGIIIDDNGVKTSDGRKVAELFGNFFVNKVNNLSLSTIPER